MDSLTVTLGNGERLLDGVIKAGAALAHDCGGKLACATCCVVIDQGREALSPPSEEELDMLDRAGVAADGARLACQASGFGEVIVRVPRPEAPSSQRMLPITCTADASVFLTAQLAKHPGSIGMRLAVTPDDPVSLPFIQGSTVRLAREGLARRLRFDNPNARQSCGCGESFGT